eukprot:9473186-Pyramimonas_sp.AAC.1
MIPFQRPSACPFGAPNVAPNRCPWEASWGPVGASSRPVGGLGGHLRAQGSQCRCLHEPRWPSC